MLHFNFNLADALAGNTASSPALVLGMLRNLPEGSRFGAIMSAPGDDDEPKESKPLDPAIEAMLDRMTWTEDRRLMAQILNQINFLIRYSIQWQKGKEPEFPVVGPAEWRESQTPQQGSKSIMDVLRDMGHHG